ncbi:MAG: DUF1295 domain-containing protein [Bdellovibrionota bacterium]
MNYSMGMIELTFYRGLLLGWTALSAIVFLSLLFLTAPYGRHLRKGWGPSIASRTGWMVMESPSVFLMAGIFFLGDWGTVSLVLLLFWQLHYVHRALIFPFRSRNGAKPMPISIVLMAVFFNLVNAYLNGRGLSHFGQAYDLSWFGDPRFLLGSILFFGGMAINWQSDQILFRLRKPGETDYKIPHGGLYRWISCPNYFGEMIEWIGWAVATWSVFGAVFAIWTAANLLPRAISHHRWYREKFPEYPRNRRALIPGLL